MEDTMIPVYCPLCCDQPFEDQQALFFHLRGIRNNMYCPICSERFASLEFLVNHLALKCYGPLSSREAKRKCVLNSTLKDESKQSTEHPLTGTECKQSNGKTPKGSCVSLQTSESKTPSSSSVVASNEHTDLIPPELKNRLSRSVTLSVGPVTKGSDQINDCETPTSTSSNKVNSAVQCAEISAITNVLPSSNALKLSLNSSVDISVKNVKNTENEVIEMKSLNSSVDVSQKRTKHLSKKAALAKSAPPMKSVETEVQSTNTRSVKPGPLSSKLANSKPWPKPLSWPELGSNTIKKKRGRPRKYSCSRPGEIDSPVVNGATKLSEQEYILPDITDSTELSSSPYKSSSLNTNSDSDEVTKKSKSMSSIEESAGALLVGTDSDHDNDLTLGVDDCDSQTEEDKHIPENTFNKVKGDPISSIEKVGKETECNQEGEIETKTTNEDEEEYTCSACDMRFTSIYEHIKQYHNGEEVVVEVPEEEIKEDLKTYQNENETKVAIECVTSSTSDVGNNEAGNNVSNIDCSIDNPKNETKNKVNLSKTATSVKTAAGSVTKYGSTSGQSNGKWIRTKCGSEEYYQFVCDKAKLHRLIKEFKTSTAIHPVLKIPVKDVFENPKINVIEITYKPGTPFLTFNLVDFKKAMPMYIMERQFVESEDILGGIASYVHANPTKDDPDPVYVPDDSKVITVMKVILASDQLLTIENLVFRAKPLNENMIPVLEDISEPDIPLLRNAKILKWECIKCLARTWKFPLSTEVHFCYSCHLCHKPFSSNVSFKIHMSGHKKDKYCSECHTSFAHDNLLGYHSKLHKSRYFCPLCKLFMSSHLEEEHRKLHEKSPEEQFPCSLCHKIFASSSEVNNHQSNFCARLVAKYNCTLCDKRFFSLTALTYHSREHKSITIKFPCQYCHKTFTREKEQNPTKAGKRKSSGYMQKLWHERIHTRDRPYLCSACPKRFRSQFHQSSHADKVHASSTHRDVPMHMCQVCDKVFHNSSELASHYVQHKTAPQTTA